MWRDVDDAARVVREFLPRGYRSSWDKLIADPQQGPHGCLMQCATTTLKNDRWDEVGFHAGRILRSILPNVGEKKWQAMVWESQIDRILEITLAQIQHHEGRSPPLFECTEPSMNRSAASAINGAEFAPWLLFRNQHAEVPESPGVYIFGYFSAYPDENVDPVGENVIYIGYTGKETNRRTLRQRLDEFERTAMDLPGHSAGWIYRTEFAKDWESLVMFRNTYITWRAFGQLCANEPYELEQKLLRQYREKWRRRPFLNRK